jgi:hypothetical protein
MHRRADHGFNMHTPAGLVIQQGIKKQNVTRKQKRSS